MIMLELRKSFTCYMKTRREMERDIPSHLLGWWHDCCHGKILKLRQAIEADIIKAWIRTEGSRRPEDYMVTEHGQLILKKAIKEIREAA